jgi:hypothetical protein
VSLNLHLLAVHQLEPRDVGEQKNANDRKREPHKEHIDRTAHTGVVELRQPGLTVRERQRKREASAFMVRNAIRARPVQNALNPYIERAKLSVDLAYRGRTLMLLPNNTES